MRVAIVGDVHWCKFSSIVRQMGEKYSVRLENCINTLNWIEVQMACMYDKLIYLGDFFDSSLLSAMEITALKEVHWNPCEHILITGNHELGLGDASLSSAQVFDLQEHFEVISKPCRDKFSDFELCYLPYIKEQGRQELSYYFGTSALPRVIFSHNDIKGFRMGAFESKTGFDILDIQSNCTLYFNGHLHNGGRVADKIYNVGNITGQNFSEDATRYEHSLYILDTDTMQFETYENPYALNFYKPTYSDTLTFKNNSVVTMKVSEADFDKAKEMLETSPQVIAHRLLSEISLDSDGVFDDSNITLSVDHLEKFREFMCERLGDSKIVMEELSEVCCG